MKNKINQFRFVPNQFIFILNQTANFGSTAGLYVRDPHILSKDVKHEIKNNVQEEYKTTVPKFREPDRDPILNAPSSNSKDIEKKYDTYIKKHNGNGSDEAYLQNEYIRDKITEETIKNHPEYSSETIATRVEHETHIKFFSKSAQDLMLPKQEDWLNDIQNEKKVKCDQATYVNSNTPNYQPHDFKDQDIIGSPGCNSSDAPDNTSISSNADISSDGGILSDGELEKLREAFPSTEKKEEKQQEEQKEEQQQEEEKSDNDKGSTNKRSFSEDSNESSDDKPSKKFKQDSSDITSEGEPFDFGGGDD